MSLDLGALVGHVVIDSAAAEAKLTALLRLFGEFGARAEGASAGTAILDRELVGVATAATQAAAGLDRAAAASRTSATSEEKAAAAATAHARAVARVAEVMTPLAEATGREQAAALRLVAAQERLNAVQASGVATTRQLASAQAGVITAERGVAAAQAAAAAGSSRWATALGGVVKTAGALGLVVGVLAAAKGAIDITKEANSFQRDMVMIQTNADVTAAEVNKASGALLDMAGPVAAGPADLAIAFYHAKAVGLDYAKALDTTKIAAEGAKVGHGDLEQTMNALTSTVASGIPGVEDMSGAMGQLIAIVGTGDMKLTDLNQALGSGILTVVKGYGLSLTDVGAALATFGDNNIRGADAATMLRMAVQAMAVPAKAGRDRLEELGLSADTLAKDMQTGGLNKAILDLKGHLDAAGVSSVEIGATLTEIFGKRAGPGIAVLVGQVDRLQSKFAILRDSGATFGDKWTATTQTASFALSRFGHMLESAGIQLTEKLGPSIAEIVGWLTVNLPHAVAVVQSILSPFEHEVGTALVVAWHALVAVLSVAADALSEIAHVAEEMKGPLTDLGTIALIAFAAFKGAQLARVGILLLGDSLVTAKARAIAFATAAKAVAVGEAAMSAGGFAVALAAVAVAGYAAGKGISSMIEGDRVSQKLGSWTANVNDFRDALVASNGAINDSIRLSVAKKAQDSGMAERAHAAGISTADLTTAITGNDKATQSLIDRWKASGKPSDDVLFALVALHKQYGTAADSAKDLASVTKDAADASAHLAPKTAELTQHQKDLNQANKDVKMVMDGITYAMQGQTTAADRLSGALDTLSGRTISAMEAELSLKDAAAAGPTGAGPAGPAPGALTSAQGSASSATNRHARATEALAIAQTKLNEAIKGGNADTIAAARLRLARAQDAVTASSNAMASASERLSGVQDKVAKANKSASSSLDENTDAGRKNKEWILGMIHTANDHTNTVMKQTNSIDKSVAALKNDEAIIRSAAAAHGIYGKALDDLLAKTEAKPGDLLKLLKSQADIAGTRALALEQKLKALAKKRQILLKAPGPETGSALAALQAQKDALIAAAVVRITFAEHVAGAVNANTGALQGPGFASGGDITGPGPRGVDSMPIIAAPGEWMATTTGADVLRRMFGSDGMKAINLGRVPAVTTPGAAINARSAGPTLVDKRIDKRIENQHLHVHFPKPGPVDHALPTLMLMADNAQGGL